MVERKQGSQQFGNATGVLGVDPGLDGGLAAMCSVTLFLHRMPTYSRLVSRTRKRYFDSAAFCKIVRQYYEEGIKHAIVENVHASSQMGVSSAFSFGRTFGGLIGCLVSEGFVVHFVEPPVWKRKFGLSSDKAMAIQKAIELYPDVDFKNKDGLAEAALIAHYGMHHMELKVDPLS